MSVGWDCVAARPAIDFVLARRLSDRRKLRASFERLAANPATQAEAFLHDETGRKISIVYRHGFRIAFWVDHFAREVRIVDVSVA